MSNRLSDLIAQLKTIVPPVSSQPTEAVYQLAVLESVADFGRRCPATRMLTINILANVADYDLPADFMRITQFPSLRQLATATATGMIIVSANGIVPLATTYTERWSVRNRKLTLFPTPRYAIPRPLFYAAGYALEGEAATDTTESTQAFTELSDEDAAIAMHKAAELILMQIANGVAGEGWSYAVVDMSVNKSGLSQVIRDQAKAQRELYDLALASRAGGTQTIQADYNANEYGSFAGHV